jgi:hypothetical protein
MPQQKGETLAKYAGRFEEVRREADVNKTEAKRALLS